MLTYSYHRGKCQNLYSSFRTMREQDDGLKKKKNNNEVHLSRSVNRLEMTYPNKRHVKRLRTLISKSSHKKFLSKKNVHIQLSNSFIICTVYRIRYTIYLEHNVERKFHQPVTLLIMRSDKVRLTFHENTLRRRLFEFISCSFYYISLELNFVQ